MKKKILPHGPAKKLLAPLVANRNGEIFELEGYGAVAMAGSKAILLSMAETVKMPFGSELMMLPNRKAVVYNFKTRQMECLTHDPLDPREPIFPVAVFNSPGYVNRYFCAYENSRREDILPLFSYGAAGWGGGGFRSAAIQVDREPRQDLRRMPKNKVLLGVKKMQARYPDNRLMRHLERCGLEYGCPAAKNFFLGRYEAPLPTSRVCNADCLGCISLQKTGNLVACQERINFTPTPLEISQTALEHIGKTDNAVVSFGQGCEGDPLTAFDVIEPAIRAIRKKTDAGTINMNTNAGIPHHLEKLFDAGLDSIRVSMNSVRSSCYTAYFRPKNYLFNDVIQSIETAGENEKFVSINYLNCPGITDSEIEFTALKTFLKKLPVRMIQWRNMNYDPTAYVNAMETAGGSSRSLGMESILTELKQSFPDLIHGYFNPPKEKFSP